MQFQELYGKDSFCRSAYTRINQFLINTVCICCGGGAVFMWVGLYAGICCTYFHVIFHFQRTVTSKKVILISDF